MITVSTWPLQNTNHRVNAVPAAGGRLPAPQAGYKFPIPQAGLRRGPVAGLRRGPVAGALRRLRVVRRPDCGAPPRPSSTRRSHGASLPPTRRPRAGPGPAHSLFP